MKGLKENTQPSMELVCTSRRSDQMRRCLACGTTEMNGGRRYCSIGCREQILWVLSLAKGLLSVFNARYAAFTFDQQNVFLDILPLRSKDISRFSSSRRNGRKPAEDLKDLILHYGEEWHEMVSNHNSRGYASLFLLQKNQDHTVPPDTLTPNNRISPRFSRVEKESMKTLRLGVNELLSRYSADKIRSAYKRMAKVYHPDKGGRTEDFQRLAEAHEQMLFWSENPRFTAKRALAGCWSYDGYTNRWVPPL